MRRDLDEIGITKVLRTVRESASQGLGRTIGPVLGTALYELGASLPYMASATLVAIVLLYLFSSGRVRRLGASSADAAAGKSGAPGASTDDVS